MGERHHLLRGNLLLDLPHSARLRRDEPTGSSGPDGPLPAGGRNAPRCFRSLADAGVARAASWQEPCAHPGAVFLGDRRDSVGTDCGLPLAAAGNSAGRQHSHVPHRHLDGRLWPLVRDCAGERGVRCCFPSAARKATHDVDGGAGRGGDPPARSAGKASAIAADARGHARTTKHPHHRTLAVDLRLLSPDARRSRRHEHGAARIVGCRAGSDPMAGIALAILLE